MQSAENRYKLGITLSQVFANIDISKQTIIEYFFLIEELDGMNKSKLNA